MIHQLLPLGTGTVSMVAGDNAIAPSIREAGRGNVWELVHDRGAGCHGHVDSTLMPSYQKWKRGSSGSPPRQTALDSGPFHENAKSHEKVPATTSSSLPSQVFIELQIINRKISHLSC